MNQTDFGDEVFKHCRSEEQPSSPPPASSPTPSSVPSGGTADGIYAIWIIAWILLCLWLFS